MEFNLGKDNKCIKCKFEALSGNGVIQIDRIIFRNLSASKIADIMKKGLSPKNQELIIDSIDCKKTEYEKLEKGKRYKASFVTIADAGSDNVIIIEFVLGNIDIDYDIRNVQNNSDIVNISFAKITVYPYGDNYFKIIDN